MHHASSVSAGLISDLVRDQLRSDESIMSIVSWTFVGIFVTTLLAFYFPYISVLSIPLQSARSLLSTMPTELLSAVPDLRATIRDVATEVQLMDKTGGGSAPRARTSSIAGRTVHTP